MTLSITEFRRDVFNVFDRAFEGEPVEVLYNGRKMRLVPEEVPSKLSRLVQRDTLTISSEELESAIAGMRQEGMAEWEKEWS